MKEVDRNRPVDRETFGILGGIAGDVGLALEGSGSPSEAISMFEESVAWRKRALDLQPAHPDSIQLLAIARLQLADHLAAGERDRARGLYGEVIGACELLVTRQPVRLRGHAVRARALAGLARIAADHRVAIRLLEEAEQFQRRAQTSYGRPELYRARLREIILQRAEVLDAAGEESAASRARATADELARG